MKWIYNRVIQGLLTIFVVVSLSFALIRLMPGGPMDYLRTTLMREANVQDAEQLRAIMEVYVNVNPNKPLLDQYVEYLLSIGQGDFGRSIVYNEPVAEILARALPWTVFVMAQAVVGLWVLGVVLGALMAYFEGSRLDLGLSSTATILNSVPYYVYAVLFAFILGRYFAVLPSGGRFSTGMEPGFNVPFLVDAFVHSILPVLSFIIASWGGVALGMRGNSISVLGEDYLRVGQLRALPTRRLAIHYVGRNAILPLYTRFMITLGAVMGGSIILEEIFRYAGVGFYMFRAIGTRDYPLLMGGFIVITTAVVIGVFVADLTYGKIDPRISAGGSSE